MVNEDKPCNSQKSILMDATVPVSSVTRMKHLFIAKMISAWLRLKILLERLLHICRKKILNADGPELILGDWVEVKSFDEICTTLDLTGRNQGLYFMPAMKEFCGGRYRVIKIVKTIKLESTGELRKLKSPTALLDGVFCKGRHEHCDRVCYHFWRTIWLIKVSPDISEPQTAK